ncbi:hypothetical protein [Noviherbaspirillum galbum]|uniref:DUF2116 family Zn-ribbon domain-containing protein n=1 Tax=Noviherbaspirillum galbum TaxID=2709383 RepID=A0A6B3SNM2_9BURK|nr:hypothetical protein [Noviherbaspirillum galbum]NEX60306.1 hypothetical protein [Noviherbaspirillum galbum]
MDDANQVNLASRDAGGEATLTPFAALRPKGACWYCNQPLDNVRKFCSKDCADDYRTEEEVFNGSAG